MPLSIEIEESKKEKQLVLKDLSNGQLKKIPFSASLAELKKLASQSLLSKITCDFFAKLNLTFEIERKPDGSLQGTSLLDHKPLNSYDLVTPYWTLSKGFLKTLHEDVDPLYLVPTWSVEAKKADRFLKELEPKSFSLKDNTSSFDIPVLVLHDTRGSFANFYLSNGSEEKPSNDKAFLYILQQAGYQPKPMANTSFFCPTSDVAKALGTLLKAGWFIRTHEGKELSLLQEPHYHFEVEESSLKGHIQFSQGNLSLPEVTKALKGNTPLVQLMDGKIGVIENSATLEALSPMQELIFDGTKASLSKAKAFFFEKHYGIKKETPLASSSSALQATLRPYQEEGVFWLKQLFEKGLGGILADEMGLGKTLQMLGLISYFPNLSFLIVVPTSLLHNWSKEIDKFLPSFSQHLYYGSNRTLKPATITLTTHALLRQDFHKLSNQMWDALVIDEAQAIKNASSLLAESSHSFPAKTKFALSGTPIENRLEELWSLMEFSIPGYLGKESEFVSQSHAALNDFRHLKLIRKKIAPFILKRRKEDVAKDLPAKIEEIVEIDLSDEEQEAYRNLLISIQKGVVTKISENGAKSHRMEILEAILRLRQAANHPYLIDPEFPLENSAKLQFLLSNLEELRSTGRKALIYSQFTSFLKIAARLLQSKNLPFVYLDGETKNRQEVVHTFQTDPNIPFFLLSLKAGGTGLNLTAADTVFLLDPWWNDAVENQAIDRAHRIGQTSCVYAKKFIANGTIESKILELKKKKRDLITSFSDETSLPTYLSDDDLLYLLQD